MNPIAVGAVLTVMRIWDAVTDPLMGWISDNHRSRFGRRRPFIFAGALLAALTFPLVWLARPAWNENSLFVYFILTSLLYCSASTIFSIPYFSLGLERPSEYHEKTRLWSFRAAVIPIITLTLNWSFAFAQSDVFDSPLHGFQVFAIGFGLVMMVTGLLPALLVKDRSTPTERKRVVIPLGKSIKATLQCRSFMFIAAAVFLMTLSSAATGQLGLYLKLYYVYGGDIRAGAMLSGWVGTVYQTTFLLFIPLIVRFSVRYGKRNALFLCLGIQCIGDLSKFISYDPQQPYLVLITAFILATGAAGVATLLPSMISDICDRDELRTGTRREGMFSAGISWFHKFAYSIAGVMSGVVLVWSGFDLALAGRQEPETFLWMLFWLSAAPAACTCIAFFLMRRNSISETEAEKLRARLAARREITAPHELGHS